MPNTSVAIRPDTSNIRKAGSRRAVTSTTSPPMIAEVRSAPVLPPILTPLVFSATAAVFDSEGQFAGTKLRRDWQPEPLDDRTREVAADYLDLITDYIRPGDQEQISLRLAALRAHWMESDDDQSVKQLVAVDWQRSVGIFPLWAVVSACEDWIDTQRRRPMIADIRKLCAEAVEEYVLHIDILRKALAAA